MRRRLAEAARGAKRRLKEALDPRPIVWRVVGSVRRVVVFLRRG
jgi:hypothetical protein